MNPSRMSPFNEFSQHGVMAMPQAHQAPDNLDVTISVGFLNGLFMKEPNKPSDWQQANVTELDAVKVVVLARNETTSMQADDYITSAPLENPKPIGDWMSYTALFPLKGSHPTSKITLPGLICRDDSITGYSAHEQYKRETVELLITLVFGNEAITVGKARILITGEEFRTKQVDVPIDISKESLVRSQKRSHFPMKRSTKEKCGHDGDLAPVSFRHDRRRRKFQIETDAVLRVFYKVSPHDPFKNNRSKSNGVAPSSVAGGKSFFSSRSRRNLLGRGTSRRSNSSGPRNRSNRDIPKTIIGYQDPGPGTITSQLPQTNPSPSSMSPHTIQQLIRSNIGEGQPSAVNMMPYGIHHPTPSPSMGMKYPGMHSVPMMPNTPNVHATPSMYQHMQSRNPMSSGDFGRSPSAPRSSRGFGGISASGSYYGGSSSADRTGPPGSISSHQRSQSTQRNRYGSGGGYGDQPGAYGGSSYGYGGGNVGVNSSPPRQSGGGYGGGNFGSLPPSGGSKKNVTRSSMQSYGGSSYGGNGFGSSQEHGRRGRGTAAGGGYSRYSRSQSPYMSRNF